MEKKFILVELPKDDSMTWWEENAVLYDEYEWAFDAFNERLTKEGQQVFRMPKGNPPLRAGLKDVNIELWVITRTDELVKA